MKKKEQDIECTLATFTNLIVLSYLVSDTIGP